MPPHSFNKARAKELNAVDKGVRRTDVSMRERNSVKVNDEVGQIEWRMLDG